MATNGNVSMRIVLATLALLVSIAGGSAEARAFPAFPVPVSPSQVLAVLLTPHEAFARPMPGARRLAVVQARRTLTGEPTVLPVLRMSTGADGSRWLQVRLPGRPNGHSGWIRKKGTRASVTVWHILVATSRRLVIVYESGRQVRTADAIVGKPSTPTPHGEFFVEEAVELPATDPGAPFALALSARSEVLQTFDGGPGQVAVHGLAHLAGRPGTAVSHGCVRLTADMMRWLVSRIGPGVPVTITN